MEKTIVIDGVKYRLVPEKEEDILSDYTIKKEEPKENVEIGKSGYPKAVPVVSDYRERYKQKKIKLSDVVAPKRPVELSSHDSALDQFNYKGESLFYGPGLEEDF